MNVKTKLVLDTSVALMLFALGMLGCGSGDSQETTDASSAATSGEVVQFAAYDLEGNMRQSSEWIGKQPVVINFWGTWCPPCRREIPDMVEVYDEFKNENIEIIGLAVNDTPEKVKAFAQENHMDWVLLMGSGEIAELYGGITSVPTTIFLNAEGKEIGRFRGMRQYKDFKQAFQMLADDKS